MIYRDTDIDGNPCLCCDACGSRELASEREGHYTTGGEPCPEMYPPCVCGDSGCRGCRSTATATGMSACHCRDCETAHAR